MGMEHCTVHELKMVRKWSVKCNKVKTEILWGVLMPWRTRKRLGTSHTDTLGHSESALESTSTSGLRLDSNFIIEEYCTL